MCLNKARRVYTEGNEEGKWRGSEEYVSGEYLKLLNTLVCSYSEAQVHT